MNVLAVLIPISLILGGLALAGFIWTIRSNQYEDLEGDAFRILIDNEDAPKETDDPDQSQTAPDDTKSGNDGF